MTCANQEPFLFSVLREKRNGSWTPKRKGRQRDELLYSSMARHRDRRNIIQLRCNIYGQAKHTEPRAGAGQSPGQKVHGASANCGVPSHASLRKRRPWFCPWAPRLCVESRGHFLWLPFLKSKKRSFPNGKEWVLTCAGSSRRTRKLLEINLSIFPVTACRTAGGIGATPAAGAAAPGAGG